MSFVSAEFIVLIVSLYSIFFFLKIEYRWILLLPFSLFFFAYLNPSHLILLLGIIIISYYASQLLSLKLKAENRQIEGRVKGNFRLRFFFLAILILLFPLLYFKYGAFLTYNIDRILGFVGLSVPVITLPVLPLGISFFTLQAVGYLIDIYNGKVEPPKNIFRYACFICFFPQLVAGPIERFQNIDKQLKSPKPYLYSNFTDGLKVFSFGLFKKVVVADNLGTVVDPVFYSPTQYPAEILFMAVIGFSIQIYCDFSGYSDMAIGLAKTLGIDLMKNFNMPYFAKTIPEFWQRWHISLSTWFRDYLYIPLGGSRVGQSRFLINILIVFGVSGFWHGANFTFIAWGLIHAFCYLAYHYAAVYASSSSRLLKYKNSLLVAFGLRLLTLFIVILAWTFFRANDIWDALYICQEVSGLFFTGSISFDSAFHEIVSIRPVIPVIGFGSALVLFGLEYAYHKGFNLEWLKKRNVYMRWVAYYALVFVILCLGNFGKSKFIYFQF